MCVFRTKRAVQTLFKTHICIDAHCRCLGDDCVVGERRKVAFLSSHGTCMQKKAPLGRPSMCPWELYSTPFMSLMSKLTIDAIEIIQIKSHSSGGITLCIESTYSDV